jgi:hypothetical protein
MLFSISIIFLTFEAVFSAYYPSFCIQDDKASMQYGKEIDTNKEGFYQKFGDYQIIRDVFSPQDCCTICVLNQFYWCVLYEYNTITNKCTLWQNTEAEALVVEEMAAPYYINARNKVSGNWISPETLDTLRLNVFNKSV